MDISDKTHKTQTHTPAIGSSPLSRVVIGGGSEKEREEGSHLGFLIFT